MKSLLGYLFQFEGRVSRIQYFCTAIVLAVVKYAIDFTIASHATIPWPPYVYVLPVRSFTAFGFGQQHPHTYLLLWLLTIPFFFSGVGLTIRRLRDAGYRLAWAAFFFLPVFNFLMFLVLSLAPTASDEEIRWREEGDKDDDVLRPDAPILGVVIAVVVGLGLVYFSANFLMQYAWGLFLGVPYVIGFIASWFMNARIVRSKADTVGVSVIAPLIVGLCLLGFRFEGMICLAMAIPLAIPLSIAGALTARTCLANRARLLRSRTNLTACVALLPFLMLLEHHSNLEPPTRPVVSSIIVNAPVDAVWRNVIAFPPLAPPKELLFHTGIAYPIGATITGRGPGAIRRCRFSTGDFVEPITTWDENHLLAFSVAAQPPALDEITLGTGPIRTPHLELNYLRSRHGQFRLVALDANHTLLEGTTWYQDYFWPQTYWRAWSDMIIHRIHLRVLEHVKANAERESAHS
ncbi:DUF805 domain-containing protein [Granulicella cerasi]|uniref:DUF805 domain-containing protein n=1 Tax=Granulicella cerasi TaxID=741063 RepID=A0ABW1Z5A7_9BACT|nr:DUF805 domain-containing protein [Granulicella cerasi]